MSAKIGDIQLEKDIFLLCEKVREVLDNNDWPTEEGHDFEETKSPIRILVESIEQRLL